MKTTTPFAHKTQDVDGQKREGYSIIFLNDSAVFKKGFDKTIAVAKATFGREEGCTIQFGDDDETVSGKHACIEQIGDSFFLIHLSQSNPTLINGVVIDTIGSKQKLRHNDQIQLSRTGPMFQFKNNDLAVSQFTKRFHIFVQKTLKPYKIALYVLMGFSIIAVSVAVYQYFKYKPLLSITENIQKQHGEDVKKIRDSVYLIRAKSIKLNYADGSQQTIELKGSQGWEGTGFLCKDGRFVTARHVIEPWLFFDKNNFDMIKINLIATQGGKVTVFFEAQSPNFMVIKLTNHDFITNKTIDINTVATTSAAEPVVLIKSLTTNDWAYSQTKFKSGSISLEPTLSDQLTQTTQLHVLGYVGGKFQNNNHLEPLYSTTTVAQNGIIKGFINVTDRTFDVGCSGGPVFTLKDNQLVAIGIVVSKMGEIGRILPISVLK
jgi:hypothetical protein